MVSSPERRSGRRPGSPVTREAILAAAREAFLDSGYRTATIRGIAAQAAVDPALVMHFFGNKEALFQEAMRLQIDPSQVFGPAIAGDPSKAGETIVRYFLEAWESESQHDTLLGLVRSAVSEEIAAEMIRTGPIRGAQEMLAAAGVDNPELRAALVGTQLIGLAMARYIVNVEPIASAGVDELAAAVGPTLQRYISEPLSGGLA